MTRSSDPTRPATQRRPWSVRVLLAGLLAVGMAIAGLAFAAPANAKTGFPSLELVSTSDCDYDESGELTYAVSDLLPSASYKVMLTTADGTPVSEWHYTGVHEGSLTTDVDPGDYRLTLFVQVSDTEWELADEEIPFTIGACLDLDLAIVAPTCSLGDSGSYTLALSGLIIGETYSWQAGDHFGTFVAESDALDISFPEIPPGNYIAYVEWDGDGVMFDWRAFAIEPCQPDLTVTVTQCTVAGGTGTVDVALANLVHGVVYTVTGPDGSTQQATAQPSGITNLTFPSIAGGTTSTATVTGTWTVDQPYEEPPFIGGGDFVPLDTVTLAANADVTLDPCPAAVVPAGDDTTALPATGADPTGPLTVAFLVLALGGIALAASRRREAPLRR